MAKFYILICLLFLLSYSNSYTQPVSSALSSDSIYHLLKSRPQNLPTNNGVKISTGSISTKVNSDALIRAATSTQPIDKGLCVTSAYSVTVCADGSPAFLLKFFGGSPSHLYNIARVRIKEGSSSEIYGEFININPTPDTLFATYKNPISVPGSGLFNRLTIQVYLYFENYLGYEPEMGTFPLYVYRPPIFMVHGLWSNKKTFGPMLDALAPEDNSGSYLKKFVQRADYSTTNTKHFSVNTPIVAQQLNQFVYSLRQQESCIGVTKVDFVGHSMGGILGRLYLQSDYYQDDIFRMVTINTPHAGSQIANVLLDVRRYPFNESACDFLHWENDLAPGVLACNDGAVADLCVDSDGIRNQLNGSRKNYRIVPSHAITTTATLISLIMSDRLVKQPKGSLSGYFNQKALQISLSSIFGEPNDNTVALSSQKGGTCTSNIEGQVHSYSPKNPSVINRLYSMLIDKPNSAWYCNTGFNPPILSPPYLAPIGLRVGDGQVTDNSHSTSAGTVKITSPARGTIIKAGTTITVTATGTAITEILSIVAYSSDTSYAALQMGTSFSDNIQTTTKELGRKYILVYGKTASGALIVDSSYVYITDQCSTLQSGNWVASSTWSCGHEPTVNDMVEINQNHVINVTTKTSYARKVIYKGGRLKYMYPGAKVSIGLDYGIVELPNSLSITNFSDTPTILTLGTNARSVDSAISFDYNSTNGSQANVWATNPMSFTNGFETSFSFSVEAGQYIAFKMTDLVDNSSKYIGLVMSTTNTNGFSQLPAEFVSGSGFKSILDNQVHTAKIVVTNTYYGAFTVSIYLDGPSSFYGTPLFWSTAYTTLPTWFSTPKLIGIAAYNNPIGTGKSKIYNWTFRAL